MGGGGGGEDEGGGGGQGVEGQGKVGERIMCRKCDHRRSESWEEERARRGRKDYGQGV